MWSRDLSSNLLKLHAWYCLHFLAITQSMIKSVTVKPLMVIIFAINSPKICLTGASVKTRKTSKRVLSQNLAPAIVRVLFCFISAIISRKFTQL